MRGRSREDSDTPCVTYPWSQDKERGSNFVMEGDYKTMKGSEREVRGDEGSEREVQGGLRHPGVRPHYAYHNNKNKYPLSNV